MWVGRRICLLRCLTWSQAATDRKQTLQLYRHRHPPSATQNSLRRQPGERLMPGTFHYLCAGREASSHSAVQVGTTTEVTQQNLRQTNYQPINGCTISASTSKNVSSGTQTHLPCPEPPILQGIHLRLRESTDPILECLIPRLPLSEQGAISLSRSRIRGP